MDLVSRLNDRNLSFPDRCSIASSLLKPSDTSAWLFPRKNQYLFDWLTGSLLKLAKTDSPKPEIFLNKQVWLLMQEFSWILSNTTVSGPGSRKRRINFITNDEEFFDYNKCFDSQVFTIKCPLLTIFQTSLSLLEKDENSSNSADMICSVILAFLQQNRVSLPVSFSQVTEFVRSLVRSKTNLPSTAFTKILRPTLVILNEIILGGGANYKKTYPLLVKFCIETATVDYEADEEIWIEFMAKCLFSQEFIDELLTFLTCPAMIKVLTSSDAINEATFPKSLTFQKVLFTELSSDIKAVESCPLIYEAFLRSCDSKIDRETGFNFFAFLLRKTLPNSSNLYAKQLTKLIQVLQERGNEIYQQRNDQIYRNQTSVIEGIIGNISFEDEDASSSFPLLLSLAKLNYYLISERLNDIFPRIKRITTEVIEFIVGIFELSALANQLPVLLDIILKSEISTEALKDERLQTSLTRIFNKSLSPVSLHQIYLTLTKNLINDSASNLASVSLLVPVLRSIVKVVDNVDSFDKEMFAHLQRKLLESGQTDSYRLLSEIVRWSPGTYLLIEELFNETKDLNLIFTLKCKDPLRVSCKSLKITSKSFDLVLKYLPIIADDLKIEVLNEFCKWLLENDETVCLSTLKMNKFYEIRAIQEPFLNQLKNYIGTGGHSYINQIISLLPWEYVNNSMSAELIKKMWSIPSAVSHLLKLPSPLNVRRETLKILISTDLSGLVNFFLTCDTGDDLVSKCFDAEHSSKLIKAVLKELESRDVQFKLNFVAKMLKFADFESSELILFIETSIDPVGLLRLKTFNFTVELFDSLDTILEWIVEYRVELVAACILALPVTTADNLEISVRCQALRCKFPSRTDCEFINESVNLASKLSESSGVTGTFKKDLLSLIKGLPSDRVKSLLESLFNAGDLWKFSFGLQALNQLLNISNHVPMIFTLFNDNLELIYARSLEFDLVPSFLGVLKMIIQLKKNVTWDSRGISNILGVLRRVRQAQPHCFDEIFVTLRLIISLHLRQCRSLLPLMVSNICEAFSGVASLEEANSLGRILSELGSLRRGELEPFALLPVLYSFISTKFPSTAVRKPLQLAMTNLMYHLGTKKQLLQLLSTALIVDHEHRVILKSFIDEYNKFHKYSGRA